MLKEFLKNCLLLIVFILLSVVVANSQGTTRVPDKISRSCSASATASVQINSDGSISIIPCPTKSVNITGTIVANTFNFLEVASYATFCDAISSIGATEATLDIPTNVTVASSCTVPKTLSLFFGGTGKLSVNSGQTVTINGQILNAGGRQIFAGSGTVSLTANKALENVNVKWFGATGDGSTDDASAIQKAVTNSANNQLVFPPGTYIINSQINLVNNTHLKGNRLAEIKAKSTFPDATYMLSMEDLSNVVIDGLIVNCDVQSRSGTLRCTPLHIWGGGSNYTFINNVFKNSGALQGSQGDGVTFRAGLNVYQSAQNVLIKNNNFDGNERDGMQMYGCRQCRIEGNIFQNTTGDTGQVPTWLGPSAGINFENNPVAVSASDAVTNSTTTLTSATINFSQWNVNTQPYIVINVPSGSGGGQITRRITAINSATNVTLDSAVPFTATGVTVTVTPNGYEYFEEVIVTDNNFYNNRGAGIIVDGRNYRIHKSFQIINNTFRDNGGFGISYNAYNLEGAVIAGNTITGTFATEAGCIAGITASGNLGLLISENVVSDNRCTGISIGATANTNVTNNIITKNGDSGILYRQDTVAGEAFVTITNNQIFNNGTNGVCGADPNANACNGITLIGFPPGDNASLIISDNQIGNNNYINFPATQRYGLYFVHDNGKTENVKETFNYYNGNTVGDIFNNVTPTLYPSIRFTAWADNQPLYTRFENAGIRIRNSENVSNLVFRNAADSATLAEFMQPSSGNTYNFLRFYTFQGLGFSVNTSAPTVCFNGNTANEILLHDCTTAFSAYRDLRLRTGYFSSNVDLFTNNTFLRGTTTGAVARNLIGIDSSDVVTVGSANQNLVAQSGTNTAKLCLNTTSQLGDCLGSGNGSYVQVTDSSQTIKLNGNVNINVSIKTTAGAYTVTASDYLVIINKATGAATTVNLPAGVAGRILIIKDGKGDAATNNITVTPAAGTIDGAATYVINANYGVVRIIYNGTEWNVM